MKKETVSGIYTCLEMLTAAGRTDLHDWWCNLLYKANGEIWDATWNASNLAIMENDLIYNV